MGPMLPPTAALALLLVLAAPAPGGTPRKVVLLLDSVTLPPGLEKPLAEALQREIRRSARYEWVDPPLLSVDELTAALSCRQADEKCMQRAVPVLKADAIALVAGTTGRAPAVQVALVEAGVRQARKASAPLGDPDAMVPALAQGLRGLLGPARPATLSVVTEPPGATVVVDGKAAGTSPTTLTDLAPGPHRVEATLAGHVAEPAGTVVQAGEAREVRITLARAALAEQPPPPAPPAQPAPAVTASEAPSPGLMAPVKWGLVGTGGVGMALSGLGVAAGMGLLAASGAVYALVWNVQAAITYGNPLVYPLGLGGGGTAALALLLAPVGLVLVVGALAADVALRGQG